MCNGYMMFFSVVLDTNVVLDCFVFKDEAASSLRERIVGGCIRWMATQAMVQEYLRVLTYPSVARRAALLDADEYALLPQVFARYADVVVEPLGDGVPRVVCRDKDDQMFIDLALAHEGILLSKDGEVLRLHGKGGLAAMTLKRFSCLERQGA